MLNQSIKQLPSVYYGSILYIVMLVQILDKGVSVDYHMRQPIYYKSKLLYK